RCAVTSSSSHDPPALPSFPTRRSSDLPKPTVSFLPETVNDPISDNARLTFPCTAQPPFSSNSLNRSSFAHTSEDLALTELFLTPIIITFTSASDGFPTTVNLFSGFWGS